MQSFIPLNFQYLSTQSQSILMHLSHPGTSFKISIAVEIGLLQSWTVLCKLPMDNSSHSSLFQNAIVTTFLLISSQFLGLQVDNHLTWKNHIDQMVPKLSAACYAVRSMYHINNINTLKSIYFSYFHSIIKYGIILGGNYSNSKKLFTLQEKVIRIMVGAQPRTPCRSLFIKLRDFTYSMSIYIFINKLYFKKSRTF
jgi:hypothetical protein